MGSVIVRTLRSLDSSLRLHSCKHSVRQASTERRELKDINRCIYFASQILRESRIEGSECPLLVIVSTCHMHILSGATGQLVYTVDKIILTSTLESSVGRSHIDCSFGIMLLESHPRGTFSGDRDPIP